MRTPPPRRRWHRQHQTATLPALSLDRQLRLLRAYATLTYPFACVPFLFLYFQQHGLDTAGYGTVIGAYYLAMFLAELPTGVLADRLGRKPMLVAGPLLLAAGFFALWSWPTPTGFVVGEVLLGVGHAVLSGPPATLLYEALRAEGQEHRYLAEEARIQGCRLVGTGCAFLLGGACAWLCGDTSPDYRATILPTCGLCVGAAAIALLLRNLPGPSAPPLREFLHAARTDLMLPAVRWLLAYWVVLFALLRYPFHNYQPYLAAAAGQEPLLLDPLLVGVLFALLNLAAAPWSSRLPFLVAVVGRRALFWAMPLSLCASLLVMGSERWFAAQGLSGRWLPWIGVAMFFVQQIPFGLHQALLAEFTNHRIGAAARTTVLSALSLAARLCYAGLNIGVFHLQQRCGMAATLWVAGGFGAVATCAVLWLRPRGLLRGSGLVA